MLTLLLLTLLNSFYFHSGLFGSSYYFCYNNGVVTGVNMVVAFIALELPLLFLFLLLLLLLLFSLKMLLLLIL